MTPTQFKFFRRYLCDWAEALFVNGEIDSERLEKIQKIPKTSTGTKCAIELFRHKVSRLPELNLRLRLKLLRDLNGSKFPHIEASPLRRPRRRRRICFVGHRFVDSVTWSLRWNLRQVLEPYDIDVDWSSRNPTSVQILNDVVSRIRRADFCIFDNVLTDGKPNVYVEAGVAYALRTPFVLFEYVATPSAARRPPSVPSDLEHATALRYKSYRELFPQFYAALPVLLRRV